LRAKTHNGHNGNNESAWAHGCSDYQLKMNSTPGQQYFPKPNSKKKKKFSLQKYNSVTTNSHDLWSQMVGIHKKNILTHVNEIS
jgi:hypothetical protein